MSSPMRLSSRRATRIDGMAMHLLRLASLVATMGGSPFSATTTTPFISAEWIDEDTPQRLRSTTSLVDGTEYDLVMSDEFNVPHRSFADGDDPTWTALDKSDDDYSSSGGGSLHFYNSSMVSTTDDGMLTIRSVVDKTEWNQYDAIEKEWTHETKNFKSGMIQSWNKFCFTGGIVEMDIILPGEPDIGGLWPAVWMLGNLGRATYESSTNNIWPWSYDGCDRDKQQRQAISGCDSVNHFGLNSNQGRGATEIDIMELMAGDSGGEALASTEPPISLPYVDLTLQVAPGIPDNRPQPGHQPIRSVDTSKGGFVTSIAENWYDNLTVSGNVSLNPFFYGTYLGETKPNEPVTRNKKQAFQADAVGSMKQIVSEHFKTPHTFRVEWQPGRGGSLDWFTKSHKITDKDGSVHHVEGDGLGQDWEHSFSIPDATIEDATGSKIPEEPTYLIMNTAISSTWGFPYDVPDWCPKCYDCDKPKCACGFNPGFCAMMKTGKVALKIDSVRVYQSKNDAAHSGGPHTLGCDPPEFPTKEFIKGYEYRYMRPEPFAFEDKHPLRDVKNGGGACELDTDCGGVSTEDADGGYLDGDEDVLDLDDNGDDGAGVGDLVSESTSSGQRSLAGHEKSSTFFSKSLNATEPVLTPQATTNTTVPASIADRTSKGTCVVSSWNSGGLFSPTSKKKKNPEEIAAAASRKHCKCNDGYTGPHCLSVVKHDDHPGAYELKKGHSVFANLARPYLTNFHVAIGATFVCVFFAFLFSDMALKARKRRGRGANMGALELVIEGIPLSANTVPMGR